MLFRSPLVRVMSRALLSAATTFTTIRSCLNVVVDFWPPITDEWCVTEWEVTMAQHLRKRRLACKADNIHGQIQDAGTGRPKMLPRASGYWIDITPHAGPPYPLRTISTFHR